MLIFNVIFSPFIILKGILPGNDAFGEWLRSIISYLVAFPATTFCFLLSFIFIGSVKFGGTTDDVLPPLINLFIPTSGLRSELNLFNLGDTTGAILVPPPLGINGMFGPGAEPLLALIGLGIFFMTPKIVEMVQEALKVPAFKYGAAIGEALNYGYGPVGKGLQLARNEAGEYLQKDNLARMENEQANIGQGAITPEDYRALKEKYSRYGRAIGMIGGQNRVKAPDS
jgi:hypothetical protein